MCPRCYAQMAEQSLPYLGIVGATLVLGRQWLKYAFLIVRTRLSVRTLSPVENSPESGGNR